MTNFCFGRAPPCQCMYGTWCCFTNLPCLHSPPEQPFLLQLIPTDADRKQSSPLRVAPVVRSDSTDTQPPPMSDTSLCDAFHEVESTASQDLLRRVVLDCFGTSQFAIKTPVKSTISSVLSASNLRSPGASQQPFITGLLPLFHSFCFRSFRSLLVFSFFSDSALRCVDYVNYKIQNIRYIFMNAFGKSKASWRI